jgi:magnesium chelatase family protein
MGIASICTRTLVGMNALKVSVEVHISNGLPGFSIVGLPEAAVRESKDRVRSAIINCNFEFPCRKITVNLAPADLPKAGSGFDLAIAIGILSASQQIDNQSTYEYEFIAELALSGQLRKVNGIIPTVIAVGKNKKRLITSKQCVDELTILANNNVLVANTLLDVCNHLNKKIMLGSVKHTFIKNSVNYKIDWSDVKSQLQAKKALEIAASGGHNLLMIGPPGSGKTMLSQRFITLLPLLSTEKALESAVIYSVNGYNQFDNKTFYHPPFRNPHHTSSPVALVGGGRPIKPGEISLAHNGVLFLDELAEFPRHVLETLREPLESGKIVISRAAQQAEFPANFQLIAAMNPCPCGYYNHQTLDCICSMEKIHRYRNKLSGPLLDRIDIHCHVDSILQDELIIPIDDNAKTSETIRESVSHTQQIQLQRQGKLNAHLPPRETETICQIKKEDIKYLSQALQTLHLSARSYHRMLRVARTIADMNESTVVCRKHIQHSLTFRQLV